MTRSHEAGSSFTLRPALPADLDDVRALLRAYQREIEVDLRFQGFEAELVGLPGAYAPPLGLLLLLRVGGEPAGCVAVRPVGEDRAEMKRLYLAPPHRGRGLGGLLARAAIDHARRTCRRALVLDTLPSMHAAAGLYRSLGFQEVAARGSVPVVGMRWFELSLADAV